MSFVQSRAVALVIDHIDTDQILPGRFLKTVEREGLGRRLFADWQSQPNFPLRQVENQGRSILLAGRNFGCGSSREHAVWALTGAGFEAVIARSFADIFRGNAVSNGLLPAALSEADHETLMAKHRSRPELEVEIDLKQQMVCAEGESWRFAIDPFAKECLLRGISPFTYLLDQLPQIRAFEARTQTEAEIITPDEEASVEGRAQTGGRRGPADNDAE